MHDYEKQELSAIEQFLINIQINIFYIQAIKNWKIIEYQFLFMIAKMIRYLCENFQEDVEGLYI